MFKSIFAAKKPEVKPVGISLGNTVRDATTGYQGIAVNRTEFLNGNTQYSLQQPVSTEGVYPDTISIDHHMLDFVDEGVAARATPATYTSTIVLGNEVECIVTGIKGIATMKTYYLNGCAAYLVCSKITGGEQLGKLTEDWVDQMRLKVVSNGIAKEVVKAPEASNGKKPGGAPMRGIPRY